MKALITNCFTVIKRFSHLTGFFYLLLDEREYKLSHFHSVSIDSARRITASCHSEGLISKLLFESKAKGCLVFFDLKMFRSLYSKKLLIEQSEVDNH